MLIFRLPGSLGHVPFPPSARRWIVALVAAGLALAAAAPVYESLRSRRVEPSPITSAARRENLETCVEGAHLFHDVRWASVCMRLAQQDPAQDGIADCDLPDAHAARLYNQLQAAEQQCFAEARAPLSLR